MGIHCYASEKRDPIKEGMIKLKNKFEKENLIGIGGSSKVKCNITLIILYNLIGLENNRKKHK